MGLGRRGTRRGEAVRAGTAPDALDILRLHVQSVEMLRYPCLPNDV